MSVPPEVEDRVAAQALALVGDIREDVDAAHRTVRALPRLELEQVACVLAAMVDDHKKIDDMAWWRRLPEIEWERE